MEALLQDPVALLEPFLKLSDGLLYLLLFAFALAENVLPPVPGDAVVVFGGYLAGMGRLSVIVTFVMVTLGSWCGFMCYYGLGRLLGRSRVHDLMGRWITPQALHRGEAWVLRYGMWMVLANRLLAGARSVISLSAGFAGLPGPVVGLMALLSAVVWNVLLVSGGYLIGEQWERVVSLLATYNRIVLTALALLAAGLLVRFLRQRLRGGKPPSAPDVQNP